VRRTSCNIASKLNSSNTDTTNNNNNNNPHFVRALDGRFASLEVDIRGHTTWLTSIYLNTKPDLRLATLTNLDALQLIQHPA
jgi:hypothetical protein